MTVIDIRPPATPPFSPPLISGPARTRLHQRVSTRSWTLFNTVITVAIVMVSTALAVIIAIKAPTVSPVALPPSAATAAPPVPVRGLLDGFTGRGGGGHR